MQNPLIVAKNLQKRYQRKHADEITVLSGASLEVGAGEAVAVVGRSGAGKSTLLHILGGIDRPDRDSGEVLVAGQLMFALRGGARTRLRAQHIGFIFQSYHLINEMDVLENVMLPSRALGMKDRAGIRRRAENLLQMVGMKQRATHTPVELSGGEQQRVAIARCLMNAPDVILADEPTGNLDEETGGSVLDMLLRLVDEQKLAMVMVTHDDKVAARCQRRLVLDQGLLTDPDA